MTLRTNAPKFCSGREGGKKMQNFNRNCFWLFPQRKKRVSQKSGWLMENQRRSGNLEPFIPASNWLHFSGGFKRRSIWLYQNAPSWQPHWALRKHRWVHLMLLNINSLTSTDAWIVLKTEKISYQCYICVWYRSRSGSKTAAPSSKSCGKVEKSLQSSTSLPANLLRARLLQPLPGTFHRLKEWTLSARVYLRAPAPPTRLRLRRFWLTTPGTRARTLRRISSLLWSSTTTTRS